MSYKGTFKPKNPRKYLGDPTNIVYRSSWELRVFNYLDSHPDVIGWSSEEFFVPYISPIDNKIHRYFPDLYVKKRNKDGTISECVYEIKPEHETKPPIQPKRKNQKYAKSVMTYAVNIAKWEACKKYCNKRSWGFQILTENDIPVLSVNKKKK